MAMGRAVITSWTRRHSDLVEEGISGFYVQPGDHLDLPDKIEYLLANPDVAIEMGRRAREVALTFSNRLYCRRLHKEMNT
jgi:glycosyltransferase involved in cell wall biosynthesis